MNVICPHCRKSFGKPATEGGLRMRLGIVIIDPDTGDVHGPCPNCKQDVTIARGAQMEEALVRSRAPGRRRVAIGIPVTRSES